MRTSTKLPSGNYIPPMGVVAEHTWMHCWQLLTWFCFYSKKPYEYGRKSNLPGSYESGRQGMVLSPPVCASGRHRWRDSGCTWSPCPVGLEASPARSSLASSAILGKASSQYLNLWQGRFFPPPQGSALLLWKPVRYLLGVGRDEHLKRNSSCGETTAARPGWTLDARTRARGVVWCQHPMEIRTTLVTNIRTIWSRMLVRTRYALSTMTK